MVLRVLTLHGGSTNPCGDVTPLAEWQKGGVAHGGVAKWQSCLRTELPEAKLLLRVTPLWVELWVISSSQLGTM